MIMIKLYENSNMAVLQHCFRYFGDILCNTQQTLRIGNICKKEKAYVNKGV